MKARLRGQSVGGASISLWCPGCDDLHQVQVRGEDGSASPGPEWQWVGPLDTLTITPSIAVTYHDERRCHSFVTKGEWQFLADSTHALAGKVAPLIDLPDWLANE